MKYLIVVEKGPHNYSAYVPDLPGCVATGKTRKAVEKNIREAIALHLQGMQEDGIPPKPPEAYAQYEEVSLS
jgi:predicted RNase H-like HicB family nuclease